MSRVLAVSSSSMVLGLIPMTLCIYSLIVSIVQHVSPSFYYPVQPFIIIGSTGF